jgi:Dolichyl-phosphate-mannose-protein mannosyltransferase
VHGRDVTNRLPGTIFWATPFYAVLGNGSHPAIYPSALAAEVASAIAIGLAFTLCCRVVSRHIAVAAALLLAFATGTWTVSSDQLWTHGPAQVAVLLTVLLASRRRWFLAGIPAGFAVLVRPHLGVVGFIIAVMAAARTKSSRPLLLGIGGAAGGVVLLAYEHALWGRWVIFGGYDQPVAGSAHKVAAFFIGIPGDLVSPERGLLVMTPALLLLLPGLRPAWRTAPDWVRSAAIAGIGYLVLQLWGIRFGGGDGFYSYRTTLESLTLAVPLLALGWREWTAATRARRTAFAALAAASVVLHAFGAVVNWTPAGTNRSPWKSYLPIDLARHIGASQTTAWICAGVVAVLLAAILAWRADVAGIPRDGGLSKSPDVANA